MDLSPLVTLSFAGRLQHLIDQALVSRPVMRLTKSQLDIADPYGRTSDEYEMAYALIHQSVATVSHALTFEVGNTVE
jgi:protein-tyrosine-phosphatase